MVLTSGSIKKQLVLFSIPIFLGTLLQQLYNVIDAVVTDYPDSCRALRACVGILKNGIFRDFLKNLYANYYTATGSFSRYADCAGLYQWIRKCKHRWNDSGKPN